MVRPIRSGVDAELDPQRVAQPGAHDPGGDIGPGAELVLRRGAVGSDHDDGPGRGHGRADAALDRARDRLPVLRLVGPRGLHGPLEGAGRALSPSRHPLCQVPPARCRCPRTLPRSCPRRGRSRRSPTLDLTQQPGRAGSTAARRAPCSASSSSESSTSCSGLSSAGAPRGDERRRPAAPAGGSAAGRPPGAGPAGTATSSGDDSPRNGPGRQAETKASCTTSAAVLAVAHQPTREPQHRGAVASTITVEGVVVAQARRPDQGGVGGPRRAGRRRGARRARVHPAPRVQPTQGAADDVTRLTRSRA